MLSYPWDCDTPEASSKDSPMSTLVKQLSEVFEPEIPKSNLPLEPILHPSGTCI